MLDGKDNLEIFISLIVDYISLTSVATFFQIVYTLKNYLPQTLFCTSLSDLKIPTTGSWYDHKEKLAKIFSQSVQKSLEWANVLEL